MGVKIQDHAGRGSNGFIAIFFIAEILLKS